MRQILTVFLMTLFTGLSIPASASASDFASPEGVWELEFRDSHFRVSYCDDDALCGVLIWLSEGASTPEKTKYLDQMVVKYAKPSGPNKWKGEMDLLGEHVFGTIEQLSDDQLALTGCKFIVLCRTYMMYRVSDN